MSIKSPPSSLKNSSGLLDMFSSELSVEQILFTDSSKESLGDQSIKEEKLNSSVNFKENLEDESSDKEKSPSKDEDKSLLLKYTSGLIHIHIYM